MFTPKPTLQIFKFFEYAAACGAMHYASFETETVYFGTKFGSPASHGGGTVYFRVPKKHA